MVEAYIDNHLKWLEYMTRNTYFFSAEVINEMHLKYPILTHMQYIGQYKNYHNPQKQINEMPRLTIISNN